MTMGRCIQVVAVLVVATVGVGAATPRRAAGAEDYEVQFVMPGPDGVRGEECDFDNTW